MGTLFPQNLLIFLYLMLLLLQLLSQHFISLPFNGSLWPSPPSPPPVFCDFEICIGIFDAGGWAGEDVWHADYEERDEEGGAEEGGCEAGSGVEMGCHGRGRLGAF